MIHLHLYKCAGNANPGHEGPELQAPVQEAAVYSPASTDYLDVIIDSSHPSDMSF